MDSVNSTNVSAWNGNTTKLWFGVAIGVAVGVGIALSRHKKKTRWDQAREITHRVAEGSPDLADATRNIVERVKTIYEQGCKVVDDASELWSHGRKLVGY
jgi:hypothetical protein